jgi:hypothetical protein
MIASWADDDDSTGGKKRATASFNDVNSAQRALDSKRVRINEYIANAIHVDPATGAPHIQNHQVEEHEVIEVLDRPGEDRAGRDGSRVALGPTGSGRYLIKGHLRPGARGYICDHGV